MFSLTLTAFVMFLIFLLFQSNLHVVLACGKSPINRVHRELKKPKQKKSQTPSCVLQAFAKCPKNIIFPKFLVITLVNDIYFF